MSEQIDVTETEVNELYEKIKKDADGAGYNLNPDMSFTLPLIRGLLVNKKRYGYIACPCRLASGIKEEDQDMICPCDYRDPDLDEYGACFCALYVTKDVIDGTQKVKPLPDRREKEKKQSMKVNKLKGELSYPVWRCRVCGYLTARDEPPAVCPICKVSKERFELFLS